MSADLILNALPHPVLAVGADDMITGANSAAEDFFQMSAPVLRRHRLADLLPPQSPLLALAEQARARQAQVNEYRVDLSSPRLSGDRVVDVYVSPTEEPGTAVVMLIPQAMSDAMGRQLSSRGAARSVTALSAMLAHEIKNPLSGIRGAAQLLEAAVSDEDRALTQLICDETDRIVTLVERMDAFTDERPVEREPLNVHTVLGHLRRLAESGFARGFRIVEDYDPSLPPALANRDRLIQILLNLLKNAAEAGGGEIHLSTAFRPGMRVGEPRIHLPLEICVRDNGPGIPEELRPHVFDPFVTTKTNGSGLGLALVAKMVGDDGGVVEYARQGGWTVFRLLLPISEAI